MGQQLAKDHGRIVDRAAENAGVQIARGTVQGNLKSGDTAQRVSQRGTSQRGHAGIGNHDGVAVQFGSVFLEKPGEAFAADFLFAFDNES